MVVFTGDFGTHVMPLHGKRNDACHRCSKTTNRSGSTQRQYPTQTLKIYQPTIVMPLHGKCNDTCHGYIKTTNHSGLDQRQ